jgi:hypothetical protein
MPGYSRKGRSIAGSGLVPQAQPIKPGNNMPRFPSLVDFPDAPHIEEDAAWPVRLFLLGRWDEDIRSRLSQSYIGVPDALFVFHASDTVSLAQKWLKDDSLFFAKWLRVETQETEQWQVERLIDSGCPYDVSTFGDPRDGRLDHTRYSRMSSPYRPYCLLEEGGNRIVHAGRECVSMWFSQLSETQIVGAYTAVLSTHREV